VAAGAAAAAADPDEADDPVFAGPHEALEMPVHPAALHSKTSMQTIARTSMIPEEHLINPHHFLIE
jgi:hypothetical protein